MAQRWYLAVSYDMFGRAKMPLPIGRWLTLGDALKWARQVASPIASLFEAEPGGQWKHIPWSWVGLEFYQPSSLTAQSTWGSKRA